VAIRDYIKNAGLKFNGQLRKRNATNGIVLHHAAAQHASPDKIHEWHLKRSWIGAGYNVYIRKDGSVWELRPLWAVGAHAQGANSDSVGVCAEGMYHPSDTQTFDKAMPKAQYDAIVRVVRDLLQEYPSIRWIKGHKEVPGSATVCPGDYFPLEEIIQAVQGHAVAEEVDCMKKGDRGSDVRRVQKLLMQLGYPLPKYGADGIFGDETLEAVNALKKSINLPQDGVVDIATMLAIVDAVGADKDRLERENVQLKDKLQSTEAELKKALGLGADAGKLVTELREKNEKFASFFKLLNQLLKDAGQ
jgi:N-acetyl-anhydromuramyl-L-alanine amidase AmpD